MRIARLCPLDGRPDPHADNYLDWIHGNTAAPAGPSKLPRPTGQHTESCSSVPSTAGL